MVGKHQGYILTFCRPPFRPMLEVQLNNFKRENKTVKKNTTLSQYIPSRKSESNVISLVGSRNKFYAGVIHKHEGEQPSGLQVQVQVLNR